MARLTSYLVSSSEKALWPDIAAVIDALSSESQTTIIEGEGPAPAAVAGLDSDADIRAAFIVDHDAATLHRTLMARSERYRVLPERQRGATSRG